jgi:hypothetical protein
VSDMTKRKQSKTPKGDPNKRLKDGLSCDVPDEPRTQKRVYYQCCKLLPRDVVILIVQFLSVGERQQICLLSQRNYLRNWLNFVTPALTPATAPTTSSGLGKREVAVAALQPTSQMTPMEVLGLISSFSGIPVQGNLLRVSNFCFKT